MSFVSMHVVRKENSKLSRLILVSFRSSALEQSHPRHQTCPVFWPCSVQVECRPQQNRDLTPFRRHRSSRSRASPEMPGGFIQQLFSQVNSEGSHLLR